MDSLCGDAVGISKANQTHRTPHWPSHSGLSLLHGSRYQVTLKFVCRHQDMGNPMVLTRDAWLNVEVDLLAKTKVIQPHQGPQYYKLPGYPWGYYIGTKQIVNQFNMSLHNCVNGKGTLQYWEKWKQMSPEQLQTIDLFSLGWVMRSILLACCQWVSKHMSGHFSHGKNMVKWKFWNTAQCPQCSFEIEDKQHIIWCPQEAATTQWTKAVKELMEWMKSEQSNPQLIQAMIIGLQAWYDKQQHLQTLWQPTINCRLDGKRSWMGDWVLNGKPSKPLTGSNGSARSPASDGL